jgi:hypothetical protein
MATGRCEVTYDITVEDLRAFQLRAISKSPIIRKTRRNSYIGVLILFLILAIYPMFGPGPLKPKLIMLGLPLIGFPILVALMWPLERWLTKWSIGKVVSEEKPGRGLLGTHTLVLDSEGVLEKTNVNEQKTLWSGIDRIEEDTDYAFIYVTTASAHVIPLRAFSTRGDARDFIDFARTRVLHAENAQEHLAR